MAFKIDPSVLNSASLRLAVIGNNISNSGVTGFKGSDFSDVLANSSPAGGSNGVRVAGSRQLFTQGTVQSSGNSLDMAVNGKGFYRLFRPSDNSYGYTRDGSFNLDKNGYITNPSGDILTGYGVDASSKVSVGTLKQLQVDTRNSAPKATENATMNLLLDSRYPSISNGQHPFNPANADTYTSTTISTIYDQQGSSHTLQSYYVKRSPGSWDLYTSIQSTDGSVTQSTNSIYTPGSPAQGTQGQPGYVPAVPPSTAYSPTATLQFGQPGTLSGYQLYSDFGSGYVAGTLVPVSISSENPTPIRLGLKYTDSSVVVSQTSPTNATFNLDITRTQQYASDFLASTQQDGFPTGQFQSVSVDKDGTLYANYSSGQSRIVGEVVLATFPSETNLAQDRNNQFVETAASGSPIINQPGKGGAGQVLGSSIETAGVDLTSEMIKLISAQRTYQANSEVVKRQDQIMQTIIGIGQ
jgi:flagellar hook protein FlgE